MLSRRWLSCAACSVAIIYSLLAPISPARADDKGQAKLDKATALKLEANTAPKLLEVIELCEQAMSEGLDDDNKEIAKQFLAAAALQRAKIMVQRLPQVANNANQLRRLKNDVMTDIKKAIDNDPTMAEAHMIAAQISMLDRADPMAAMGHVNKAIELTKDSPVDQSQAYMLRARLQRDDTDAQLNDLKLATEADSTNMGAWQLRIMLQLSLNKLDDAYKDIQKLLENEEGSEFAVQAAFETLLKLKKYEELLSVLSKQIEKKPEESRLYRLRATVYIVQSAEKNDKELLKTAKPDLDKAIELNSRDSQSLVLRSQVLFDLGDLDQARRDIGDALVIDPNAVEGIFMRAAIAAREQRYDAAISDMELLVRAFPTREGYVRQLANYYQLDDRPRLAIRLMDELIKNNRNGWRNLRLRGDARLSVGEHAEAIADYEKAIAAVEKHAKGGKSEDKPADAPAVEATDESSDDPIGAEEHAGLLNNLAWVLATSPKDSIRNGKRALELARKSCELTEYKAAHILSTLAAAYAESGDFEKAREWSGKAVELGTADENDQLDQLKKELEGYKENKPWREEQKTEENKKQRVKGDTIET